MSNMNRDFIEAREAGARALNSLRKAESYLDSARNWGYLDMFGGGFLTTMIKRGKMNEAKHCVQQAEFDLQVFTRELADIEMPDVEFDGFAGFADYFFDGFLVDCIVQQKISRARDQITLAINRVEAVLRQLRQMQGI